MVRIRRSPRRKIEALALFFCVAVVFVAERAIHVAEAEPEPTPDLVQPDKKTRL